MKSKKKMFPKSLRASAYHCCQCECQAVGWWPCIDPDIESKPYCRKHLSEVQAEVLMRLMELEKEDGHAE